MFIFIFRPITIDDLPGHNIQGFYTHTSKFNFLRTFLLSETLPSPGNAVLYAYAIVSEYESFPHEPR